MEVKERLVELYRGKEPVGDLLSSFGDSLRETRLTSALAYVLSGNPDGFLKLYGRSGNVQRVLVEHTDGSDRTDIVLQTKFDLVVIEAKVGVADPASQIQRYLKRYKKFGQRLWPIALVPFGQKAQKKKWDSLFALGGLG